MVVILRLYTSFFACAVAKMQQFYIIYADHPRHGLGQKKPLTYRERIGFMVRGTTQDRLSGANLLASPIQAYRERIVGPVHCMLKRYYYQCFIHVTSATARQLLGMLLARSATLSTIRRLSSRILCLFISIKSTTSCF